MSDFPLIPPPPPTTPSELAGRRSARPIPTDLLRAASRRLGVLSLAGAGLWVAAPLLAHVAVRAMNPSDPRWYDLGFADGVALVSVVASVALFFYTRQRERDPAFILDLGLAYMVFTAVALGVISHMGPPPPNLSVAPMISWTGVVVLMFAAIVPSSPIKTLIVAFLAVSMNPLAMLLAKARGTWDFGPSSHALLMHYPDYLLVGVAVVISHVVTRLGQQVAKAREMGSYQLGELLGQGGMGEVHRASHRMLARPAAIKLIRPEVLGSYDRVAAERAMTRFRREAEAAASLRSPHTVQLYDFGVTEDQTLYVVMELLEGMDLESLVRHHGPMPAGRVIHLVRQVCESLEEAHASGLVHRDIKPANLHVGRLGLQYDFVKVLDFGLVKSIATTDGERVLATVEGQLMGTPAYLAPELALGEPVDGRADIYALGCVIYYLLTGQQVFEAKTAMQVITRHLQAEPVPPSARTELAVPAQLDTVVLQCLAKRPHDRPHSAAELSRRLAAVDAEAWGQEQAIAWWSRHAPPDSRALPVPPGSATLDTTRAAT